jgi:2-phospho-L-lactate guanylyltransferase (CobY/MobA/RfbA family)
MTTKTFHLVHAEARRRALQAVSEAQDGMIMQIKEPTRSLEQNSLLWKLLQAFSEQLLWPVNGHMTKLSAEDFKDVFSAAFRQEAVRLAQGLNGGVVMLGARTSKMSKREFSEFIEFLHMVAAERGIEV